MLNINCNKHKCIVRHICAFHLFIVYSMVHVGACVHAHMRMCICARVHVPEELFDSDRLAGEQASVTSCLHASPTVLGYRRHEC